MCCYTISIHEPTQIEYLVTAPTHSSTDLKSGHFTCPVLSTSIFCSARFFVNIFIKFYVFLVCVAATHGPIDDKTGGRAQRTEDSLLGELETLVDPAR